MPRYMQQLWCAYHRPTKSEIPVIALRPSEKPVLSPDWKWLISIKLLSNKSEQLEAVPVANG